MRSDHTPVAVGAVSGLVYYRMAIAAPATSAIIEATPKVKAK